MEAVSVKPITSLQKERMSEIGSQIEESFKESDREIRRIALKDDEDVVAYETIYKTEQYNIPVTVLLDANTEICRIEAVLPISVDERYEYPLCLYLAEVNANQKFGTFKYMPQKSKVIYEYSVLYTHGLSKEAFSAYCNAVQEAVTTQYSFIRKICLGKLSGGRIDRMLDNIAKLLDDLIEE